MSCKESDIAYEDKDSNLWILKVKKGYEIYKNVGTHSIKCAIIGYDDFDKAMFWLNYHKQNEDKINAKR